MMSPAPVSARTSDPSTTCQELEIVALPKFRQPVVVFPSNRSRHPSAVSLAERTLGVVTEGAGSDCGAGSDSLVVHASENALNDATARIDAVARRVCFIRLDLPA